MSSLHGKKGLPIMISQFFLYMFVVVIKCINPLRFSILTKQRPSHHFKDVLRELKVARSKKSVGIIWSRSRQTHMEDTRGWSQVGWKAMVEVKTDMLSRWSPDVTKAMDCIVGEGLRAFSTSDLTWIGMAHTSFICTCLKTLVLAKPQCFFQHSSYSSILSFLLQV